MTLGEKLQLLRRSRGLSQEQLAAELDVSRQAISKWECGDSTPDLDKLRAICTYFGVTTDYLIWERSEDAPQAVRQLSARISARTNANTFFISFSSFLFPVGDFNCPHYTLSL